MAMERKFKTMVNAGVDSANDAQTAGGKGSGGKGAALGMAGPTGKQSSSSSGGNIFNRTPVFKLDQKESAKDLQTRHAFIKSIRETKDLMYKMNPGLLDLFEAAFGADGMIGELAAVIDSKVKGILLNRVHMGLQPLEQAEEVVTKDSKGKQIQMARKSKFIKQAAIDPNEIIEEDYGMESSYDSESYYSEDPS
mmetsp:Transcript_16859/g.22713  ORF Transcript_16859/g.22713 Transcript_16859/m.22713 type:complete len:194 (+) Transcript_16859:1348-1929(+)